MIRKYAEFFCWKNVSAKATHIFSAKNIRILCIESTKTVKEMTLNELVKLTTLWTTGPRCARNTCSVTIDFKTHKDRIYWLIWVNQTVKIQWTLHAWMSIVILQKYKVLHNVKCSGKLRRKLVADVFALATWLLLLLIYVSCILLKPWNFLQKYALCNVFL